MVSKKRKENFGRFPQKQDRDRAGLPIGKTWLPFFFEGVSHYSSHPPTYVTAFKVHEHNRTQQLTQIIYLTIPLTNQIKGPTVSSVLKLSRVLEDQMYPRRTYYNLTHWAVWTWILQRFQHKARTWWNTSGIIFLSNTNLCDARGRLPYAHKFTGT